MWISGVPWQALNPQIREWFIVIHKTLSFSVGNANGIGE